MGSADTIVSAPPERDAPSHADVDERLDALSSRVVRYERTMFDMVHLVDEIGRSGLVEELEGSPLEQVLGLRFNLTRSEVWMLQTAGDCLRNMPDTRRLWRNGAISWSQVRQIVDGAKRLSREHRAVLDARLAASEELLESLDPDRLAWAVGREVDELRGLRSTRDRERRVEQSSFVSVQADFDGGGSFYGHMDAIGLSTVVGAWDAAADDLQASGADLPAEPSQRRAAGAVAAAGDYLAGGPRSHGDNHDRDHESSGEAGGVDRAGHGDGEEVVRKGPRRARPLVNFVVDVADCTTTAAGQVMLDAAGALPTITRTRLEEILSSDHDCRVAVFEGARPLAVSDLVEASEVPTKTRIAVQLRDRGGRMPGSRTPTASAHVHHLDKARHGHHPDHLVMLGPFGHLRQVHKRGWKLHVDPGSGQVTARWRDRTYRSLPWGTRLRRAPPDDTS